MWKVYWSACQRFFKVLCVSLKVPRVVAMVQAALEEGNCCVIGLQSTGEAATMSLKEKLKPGDYVGSASTTQARRLSASRLVSLLGCPHALLCCPHAVHCCPHALLCCHHALGPLLRPHAG